MENLIVKPKMRIRVEKLSIQCFVGILPQEQKAPQQIYISIEVGDLVDPLDYRDLAEIAKVIAHSKHFPLIEQLAQEILDQLMEIFAMGSAKVLIEKPGAIEGAKCASVELEI